MTPFGVMAVHAHPDDEVIGTGGVLASLSAAGHRVAVVTCTGGERGEIVGDGMDPDEVRPRLGAVRHAELTASLDILGAGPPRLLGFVDSGMMGTEGNDDPASFWRADFDAAVRLLVTEIREFRPDVLLTYDAFGGYGHPDHIQAHRTALVAVEAAASMALYPDCGTAWRTRKVYLSSLPRGQILAWGRELAARGLPTPFGDPQEPSEVVMGCDEADLGAAIDVRPWLETKWTALRAHRSQIGPESFFLNIPEDLRELAFGTEWFLRHRSDVPVSGVEDDLLGGLE